MIPVVWFTLTEGENPADKWDTGLLTLLFNGDVWNPAGGHEFRHYTSIREAIVHECGDDCYWAGQPGHGGGAVVVFPGGIHRDRYDELNAALAPLEWVLLIVTADEGSLFEAKHVHHPNMRLWVMTPRPGYDYPAGTRFIGEGFHHDTPSRLAAADHDDRPRGVFFSGQVTHSRRKEMVAALAELEDAVDIQATAGFAQGMDRGDYLRALAETKLALAPSGPVTADSFRLYETLEAGCLPLADAICPEWDRTGYWDMVAAGHPFPEILNWGHAPGIINTALNDWPGNANHAFAWWQEHKRAMAYWLVDDLHELGAPAAPDNGYRDRITVLMCTSPTPGHPSTAMIEQTIETVRDRLPDVEIIIGIDGVHSKLEHKRADYEEYTRRLLWLCNHEWDNVLPLVFGHHAHQSGMAFRSLDLVRTPFVFYVEHDLPLKGEIPFDGMLACLEDGTADHIRLGVNTALEPAHRHLFLDDAEPQEVHGVKMVRTVQWSQQPHLATAAYYRDVLNRWFDRDDPWYIELRMHSVCAGQWHKDGPLAWFRNRLWIYTPDGDISRSWHLDGRGEDPGYITA